MQFKNKKAQGMLEYALLLAIFVAVIVVMQIYVKRGLQGKFKQTADQIGEQFTTGQQYTIETRRGSYREETTAAKMDGTAKSVAELQKGWTVSDVKGGGVEIGETGPRALDEVSRTDYVTERPGAGGSGNIGTHGTFDSGTLKNKKLFGDDE